MSDLVEFLEQRIAEDESVARAAEEYADGAAWRVRGLPHEGIAVFVDDYVEGDEYPDTIHIARHDPARVLAECAARRAIVAMQAENDEMRYLPGFHYKAQMIANILRHLAASYAAHADYDQSWSVS